MPTGEEDETMLLFSRPGTDLEDALVRRSVHALEDGRTRCRDCRRTPLTGEMVYAYGDLVVCELCRPRHRTPPDASVLVRSPEHAIVVRRLRG